MNWSRVDYLWIIVMVLLVVWTLIQTAPIHCRGSWWASGLMLNFCSEEKRINLYLGVHFQKIFILRWTILLKNIEKNQKVIFFRIVAIPWCPWIWLSSSCRSHNSKSNSFMSHCYISMARKCRNVRMRWTASSPPSAATLCGPVNERRCCPGWAAPATPPPVKVRRTSTPLSHKPAAPSACRRRAKSCAVWTAAKWKTRNTSTTTQGCPSPSPSYSST